MMTIRIIQADNYILEDKLKAMTAKYEAVRDLALEKKNRDQSSININSYSTAKFSQGDFEEMLAKICQLEQQLSTTKVELAVKSAELLVFFDSFRLLHSNIKINKSLQKEGKHNQKTIFVRTFKSILSHYLRIMNLFQQSLLKINS